MNGSSQTTRPAAKCSRFSRYSTRLEAWASRQPAGFRGAQEWATLASDLRRLAAAYNTTLLRPKQQGLGLLQARRLNDAERVTAAANLEKSIETFRQAYEGVLTANTALSPQSRQAAIQRVDVMKSNARALNAAIASNQKGIAEAEALLRSSSPMIDTSLKLPQNSAAAAAWTPVRDELAKVALAYEVTPIH